MFKSSPSKKVSCRNKIYTQMSHHICCTVNEEGHYKHISSTGNFGSIGHYIATLFTFLNPFHLTR